MAGLSLGGSCFPLSRVMGVGERDIHQGRSEMYPQQLVWGPEHAWEDSSLTGPCPFSVSILESLVNRLDKIDAIHPPITACR